LDLVFHFQTLSIDLNSQILIDGENWIIYIETPNNLFLYGNNDTRLLDKLSEKIDLKNYKGKEIMGTFDLVYYLVRKSNLQNFKLIKDRLMHSTNTTECNIENSTQLAEIHDLEQLISLHQAYYNEEYMGERNKTADYLIEGVKEQIEDNEIYIIKENGNVLAFCSIINPDIGIMFTSTDHRGKGFAKQLLCTCTKQLLKKNETAYLLTDMHNVGSNKVCEKVGYKSYYKHTNLQL
jgi:predicted GNAT family acetyltransferase